MARSRKRKEDHDKDDRRDRHHHDKDHKKHKHRKPGATPPTPTPTTTEKLKELSTQSGQDAMNATPGGYPADPSNGQAVFTTGPGEAVEYNYVRVDGGGGGYAPLQSSFTAPVAGHGQVLTPAASGEQPAGMENNPT